MNVKRNSKWVQNASPCFIFCMVFAVSLGIMAESANAQIYITNLGNHAGRDGTISEYNFDGSPVDVSLVTRLDYPEGLTVSDGKLFVSQLFIGMIGEYTSGGETMNTSLIKSPDGLAAYPYGMAVSGSNLFVGQTNNTIALYTISGSIATLVNPAFITGVNDPQDLVISGDKLFVANVAGQLEGHGWIGEYSLSGSTINASLVTGLDAPHAIAVSGTTLFVTNADRISEYTTSGAAVNTTLVSHVTSFGIAASGTNLYVVNYDAHSISQYSVSGTQGRLVNPSLVTGLTDQPWSIFVVGSPNVPSTVSPGEKSVHDKSSVRRQKSY